MKINIKITPNARKTEITRESENLFGDKVLNIKVAAPPKGGKANKELIDFLSKHYKKPKSNIQILRGETNRNKIVKIV